MEMVRDPEVSISQQEGNHDNLSCFLPHDLTKYGALWLWLQLLSSLEDRNYQGFR